MGDVKKDVEMMRRLRASGSAKIRIASDMTAFLVRVFQERIKREHPRASARRRLEILRKELSYG